MTSHRFPAALLTILLAGTASAQPTSIPVPDAFRYLSTAVQISYLRAHGLPMGPALDPRGASWSPSPKTVTAFRPATTQVNSDAYQDVEPTTLNITNGGSSVTSVVWMSDNGTQFLFNSSAQVNGGGFSAPQVLPDSNFPHTGMVDPMLDANFSGGGVNPGRVYLTGVMFNGNTEFGVFLWRSDDGGRTWAAPVRVAQESSTGFYLDHPAVAVTQDNGYVYVVYSSIKLSNHAQSEIYVKGSADGGNSFGSAVCVVGPGAGCAGPASAIRAPQIAASAAGTLYVEWPDFSNDSLNVSRSATYGTTWEPQQSRVPARPFFKPDLNSTIGTLPLTASTLPMIRFNNPANVLGVVWHAGEGTDPVSKTFADVFFTSFNGTTWSGTETQLNTDPAGKDNFMPALDTDAAGNMLVDWYDRREDPNNQRYMLYGAKIASNGSPVMGNFAITTNPTDPAGFHDYGAGLRFLGDYHQTFRFRDESQWIDAFIANPVFGYSDVYMGYIYY
jgi:hypothetical protein